MQIAWVFTYGPFVFKINRGFGKNLPQAGSYNALNDHQILGTGIPLLKKYSFTTVNCLSNDRLFSLIPQAQSNSNHQRRENTH